MFKHWQISRKIWPQHIHIVLELGTDQNFCARVWCWYFVKRSKAEWLFVRVWECIWISVSWGLEFLIEPKNKQVKNDELNDRWTPEMGRFPPTPTDTVMVVDFVCTYLKGQQNWPFWFCHRKLNPNVYNLYDYCCYCIHIEASILFTKRTKRKNKRRPLDDFTVCFFGRKRFGWIRFQSLL